MAKWFVTDLDGTLLNSNRSSDDVIQNGLREIAQTGCHVIPATGRSLSMCRKFGFVPDDFIGLNGALILDKDGKVLCERKLDKKDLQIFLEEFDDMHFEFYTRDRIYMTASREEGIAYYEARQEARGRLWFSRDYDSLFANHVFNVPKEQILAMDILKANCFHPDTAQARKLEEYIAASDRLISQPSDSVLFEITDSRATKKEALRWLQAFRGIEEKDVYVYGDGINDVEMLRDHPNSFAPETALKEAREAAGTVLDSDGEYAVLEHMKRTAGASGLNI